MALMHKEDLAEIDNDEPLGTAEVDEGFDYKPSRVRELTLEDHEQIVAPHKLRLIPFSERGAFQCSSIIYRDENKLPLCCGLPIDSKSPYAFCNSHYKRFIVPVRGS